MPVRIGLTYGWSNDRALIAVTNDNYTPSYGDLLYTIERNGRVIIMNVVGFEGFLPISVRSIEPLQQPELMKFQRNVVIQASLFLELIPVNANEKVLTKASKPPSFMTPIYLLTNSDDDAKNIMREIGTRTSEKGVAVAILRSGVAHNKELAREKHFPDATFRLDLPRILSKHVLVAGQTGSGKTSGIQGILLKYALESTEKMGWLIIDRHGEYVPEAGFTPDSFIGYLLEAIGSNQYIHDVEIKSIRFVTARRDRDIMASEHGCFRLYETALDASSVLFQDFAGLGDISLERISEMDEFLSIVIHVIKELEKDGKIKNAGLFITRNDEATANAIALIPILVDNVIRYEGVGEQRDYKKGLHRILVDRGIDARISRVLRRLVLLKLNWRIKLERTSSNKPIYIIDDSLSVVKTSPLLKDPDGLARFLSLFVEKLGKAFNVSTANYQWKVTCEELEIPGYTGLSIDSVIEWVEKGDIVVIDVSRIDNVQADLANLTITRRLFENRLEKGVEESSRSFTIGIVSEEAPLYLSPDKVTSPYNVFARIAREGRKFKIGLIAITQLATIIEKQLLANFNTYIVLRTRSRSDIEFFRDIGIPVETLPYLGDREGYLYTPDLPIKEPVPIYIPAWFEYADNIMAIRNRRKELGKIKGDVAKLLMDMAG
ncbi:MAG: DUF87 domain-containing protein [Desulfurococcaceae archaeon]